MPKGTPVRQHLAKQKIEKGNVAQLIRCSRLNCGWTQRELSYEIGSYVCKSGNNIITEYESGRQLPSIPFIYKLAELLEIDREELFMWVLRTHYERFKRVHDEVFEKAKRHKNYKKKQARYYFVQDGTIEYAFPLFARTVKRGMDKLNFSVPVVESLYFRLTGKREKAFSGMKKHRPWIKSFIHQVILGERCPSINSVVVLAKILPIDVDDLYKIFFNEKVICHVDHMKQVWEKHKEKQYESYRL